MPLIIDFDSNDWMPALADILRISVPETERAKLRGIKLEYYEDALDALVDDTSIDSVVDDVLGWIEASSVRVYHGTRLTDDEVDKLKLDGMKPLVIADRVSWLQATFPEIEQTLTPEIVTDAIARGQLQHRESQVHAAISRAEMFSGYDYLFAGSEFDRRLLEYAGREDLVPILKERGAPRLVRLVIPGSAALDAMHPFFPIEFVRAQDRYPNLVRELLRAWAWHLHRPDDARFRVDACLLFRRSLPSEYIEGVDEIQPTAALQKASKSERS